MTLYYEYKPYAKTECSYRLETGQSAFELRVAKLPESGGQPDASSKREWQGQKRKKADLQENYQLIRVTICESFPNYAPARSLKGLITRIKKRFLCYRLRKLRGRMQSALRAEIAPLLDGYSDNYIVRGERLPVEDFGMLLPLPEFDAFDNPKWVRRLLAHAVYADFVVLGDVPCLQQILCELAPRMKTLLWIAPDWTAREQMEDFVEDFYQEYGLAINLHFLLEDVTYARIRIPDRHYREPLNVLDFTGDKYLPTFTPPEGSVWLDFFSVSEKEKRVEARRLKVEYVSLRKLWRGGRGR